MRGLPLLALALLLAGCAAPARSMVLATTTSTEDTGLLDALLPDFERSQHVDVKVVAVGTGRALELGRTGDADVVLVHAPGTERAYLANGSFTARYEVMYNQFLLVGPPGDPGHFADGTNVTAAFRAIHDEALPFVSRGDQSGTHIKEQQLWAAAGFDYTRDIATANATWYHSVGQGMGATLRIADQLQGYCLTDDGTFYATAPAGLVVLEQNQPPLRNQYSVMTVNATRNPHVQADLGQAFAEWLRSDATLQRIASYQVKGHTLFTPDPGVVEHG